MISSKPSNHLLKLSASLFNDSEQRERFVDALQRGESKEQAIVWTERRMEPSPFKLQERAPWLPSFVDHIAAGDRPGKHPLHDEGAYYCLDLSSVFSIAALLGTNHNPRRILDLCAAPGGKSVLSWVAFHPELLISNEVIAKRTAALISNLRRCRLQNSLVTRNDVSVLAESVPQLSDVVIVDAPCSGQSLVARGESSPGCFHPATINMNANRQRRIVAGASTLVSPGGYLAYITCTFSRAENEGVLEWIVKKFPQLSPVELPSLRDHRSPLSEQPCYRLWPFDGLGSGAFVAVLQRSPGDEAYQDWCEARYQKALSQLNVVWRSEMRSG